MKLDNFVGFFAFFELFFRFFPLLSKLYWTVVCTLLCMQTTKYIILWTKWQSCQGNFLLQCKKEEIEGGLSNVHFSDERKRVFWWNITSSLMIQITQKCISASSVLCNMFIGFKISFRDLQLFSSSFHFRLYKEVVWEDKQDKKCHFWQTTL